MSCFSLIEKSVMQFAWVAEITGEIVARSEETRSRAWSWGSTEGDWKWAAETD